MGIIELERWVPCKEDPRKVEYAGQRQAQEVFEELKQRLEGQGYLPDEYFDIRPEWENGKEIPRDADLFCTVDYGASEGVYVDVYLKWYEDGKPITCGFAVGKPLGGSGSDLDRMFLIASAITKAFHGDHGQYARYVQLGPVGNNGGTVVHLSADEQGTIISALAEHLERQEKVLSQTEQLLRRMTGSITEYMNVAGRRPLRMSDYDKAVLAIRDGELGVFKELWPSLANHADELLIEAAGRPGMVGQKMTRLLLEQTEQFSGDAYQTACKRAVDISDFDRISLLLEGAEGHVQDLPGGFHGAVAQYAFRERPALAAPIVKLLTPEQIANAPSDLLRLAVMDKDFGSAERLASNGINADRCIRDLIRFCSGEHDHWFLERLLEAGLKVSPGNSAALHACVVEDWPEAGKLLLKAGMDFETYRQRYHDEGHEETLKVLAEAAGCADMDQK